MIRLSEIIIFNQNDEILLMQRDSRIDLIDANKWDVIGGHCVGNETFEEGLVREIAEEISVSITEYTEFEVIKSYSVEAHYYFVRVDFPLEIYTLGEGQGLRYFSEGEFETLSVVEISRPLILRAFKELSSKSKQVEGIAKELPIEDYENEEFEEEELS